jgi:hypothetical protein
MTYLNVGASHAADGRIRTKKELKALLAADPATVVFDRTSPETPGPNVTGDAIPLGVKLSVVGPDPFTSRRWYATVARHGDRITVQ